jgi:acetyl-CoA carboxylase biotin carboxyl carrier protein
LSAGQVPAVEAAPATPAAAVPAPANVHEIKSPIVGTFYRSPSPDASPFVQVGSAIQSGTVLCIVEAMKLMNEIESDVSGKIVKIMVENGQPVEYDQVLFLVEKE